MTTPAIWLARQPAIVTWQATSLLPFTLGISSLCFLAWHGSMTLSNHGMRLNATNNAVKHSAADSPLLATILPIWHPVWQPYHSPPSSYYSASWPAMPDLFMGPACLGVSGFSSVWAFFVSSHATRYCLPFHTSSVTVLGTHTFGLNTTPTLRATYIRCIHGRTGHLVTYLCYLYLPLSPPLGSYGLFCCVYSIPPLVLPAPYHVWLDGLQRGCYTGRLPICLCTLPRPCGQHCYTLQHAQTLPYVVPATVTTYRLPARHHAC